MTGQPLKIGKREFVLLPKCDFERLAAQARRQIEQDRQDAGDVAESRRCRKEPGPPRLPVASKAINASFDYGGSPFAQDMS